MQTPDPNNPVKRKEERELVAIDGPVDAVFLNPGDYVELDVGTGEPHCAGIALLAQLLGQGCTSACAGQSLTTPDATGLVAQVQKPAFQKSIVGAYLDGWHTKA